MNQALLVILVSILFLNLSCNKGLLLVDGIPHKDLSVRADGNPPSITNEKGKFKVKVKNKSQEHYIFHVNGVDTTSYGIVNTKVDAKISQLKSLVFNVSPIKPDVDSTTIHLIEEELRKFEKLLTDADISLKTIESLLETDNPLVPGGVSNSEEYSATYPCIEPHLAV